MANEPTEVVLSADIQPYQQSMGQAEASTNSLIASVDKLTRGIDNAFKSAGRKMTIGGAGLTASMVAAGVAAGNLDSKLAQLQSSMTLISKSEREFEGRMQGFTKAVTNQRKEFGTSADEAIRLVTALNKLGQESRNMERLTTSYTRLSAITGEGMSGLVDGMVSLQRQMGTQGAKQTEVFSATLANLSVNAGASATGILEFSNAIAPAARAASMSQKEIMGVSTAFVKSGADGYLAANAFNKMLTDITRSIQYGSPELAAYSNLIGVTTEQFKEMSKSEALTRIFEKISNQGEGAIKTLNRFGLDGVRAYRSIQAVAQQGGLRSSIEQATGLSDTEGFNKAGDKAFEGLNDQMRMVSENSKMIGENLGKGVLPPLEGIAKAINAALGPLNSLLTSLGQIPGGALALSGIGIGAAGMVTSKALALMGLGGAVGGYRTVSTGYRAGRTADIDSLSLTDYNQYRNHQRWQQGLPAEGNWLQHQMYQRGLNRGEARLQRELSGAGPGMMQRGWDMFRGGAGAAMRGGIGLAGAMLRAGLDPLQFRTAGLPGLSNITGSNFNRDQNLQFFKDPDIKRSLKFDKLEEATRGLSNALNGTSVASKSATAATNTSINSQRQYATTMQALKTETLLFSKALAQAGAVTTGYALKGAGVVGWEATKMAGRGIGTGLGALGGAMFGSPAGAAIMAGTAGMYLYGSHKDSERDFATRYASNENKSPLATYAAALGEAAAATQTYADIVRASGGKIGSAASEFSTTVTDAEAKIASKDKGDLTYASLKGTSVEQAKAIAAPVLGSGSAEQKNLLKGDLLKVFGSGPEGRKIVEDILTTADTGQTSLTSLFRGIAEKQGKWSPSSWFGNKAAASELADSTGSTLRELLNNADANQGAQITISSINQLNKARQDAGVITMQQREQMASGWLYGILGRDATPEETAKVAELMHIGISGTGLQDALKIQEGPVGEAVRAALATPGVQRDMEYLPPRLMRNPNAWASTGIQDRVLALMRGNSFEGLGGQMEQSIVPGFMSRIFQSGPENSAISRDISTALANEGNPNAQWAGMKAFADVTMKGTKSFSEAIAALDKVKTTANDSSDALYQLASQAQAFVRQRQAEEMRYMSRSGRAAELRSNYEASLQTYLTNPNEESGSQLESDRVALENLKADTRDYMQSLVTQRREYDVSRSRAEEDFARQQKYMLFDFELSKKRAYEDFAISRERAEYDFNLQQKYQLTDYTRSRRHAYEDFTRQRLRSEEDFNHQVVLMTRQTARSMTNIYERINVQRTWSAANLMQNMQDQQARLREAQVNLGRLREAGLSGEAIMQMGLNDPNNMQQVARLTDEILNNPQLIAQFNKAVTQRTQAAELIVKDKDNEQWREMQRAFKLNLSRSEEDFGISMERQAEQFDIMIDRQRVAFRRQMNLGQEDFNRMMSRQNEDFTRQHARMVEQYSISMDRAAEDFNRQHEEIVMSFEDLSEASLKILTGTAHDQMGLLLASLGYTKLEVTKMYKDLVKDLKSLDLGITVGGMPTLNGKTLTAGTIKLPGGGTINAGFFAEGGEIPGQSPHPKADNIPIWATAGEYVQPVDAVDYYGKGFHDAVRQRKFPKELAEGYAEGGIVAFGKYLQNRDFRVSEHPAFGGVRGKHLSTAKGGLHYVGGAIDVNADHFRGGEMAAIDRLVATQVARKLYGLRTLWRTAGHYDHAHFDIGRGPDRGNFVGATFGGGGLPLEQEIMGMIKNLRTVQRFRKMFDTHYIKSLRNFGGDWLADNLLEQIMGQIDPYTQDNGDTSPSIAALKRTAKSMAAGRGWTGSNWNAIDWIVQRESSWNPRAQNPTSSAYGLFQFLDQTWGTVGGRKTSDPEKQIEYGLKYIAQRYRTPLGAKAFWERNHWYGDGAVFNGPNKIGVGERGPEAVIPLNQRGVDFVHELMKRNSTDSKRTMVTANGVPHTVNATTYYQRIDSGTHINGNIIVPANDPDTLIRKLQAKKREEAMKGRR